MDLMAELMNLSMSLLDFYKTEILKRLVIPFNA